MNYKNLEVGLQEGKYRLQKYDIIMLSIFLAVSFLITIQSFIIDLHISPDTCYYLKAANSIVSGNGFHYTMQAGNNDCYFSVWAPGYPVAIAVIAKLTGMQVFYAARVLAVLVVALIIITLRLYFGKRSPLYALLLFNYGCLVIFISSLSEQLFLLGITWFAISVANVMEKSVPKAIDFISMLISGVFLFFIKHFGIFSLGVIGICFIVSILRAIKLKKSNLSYDMEKRKAAAFFLNISIFSVTVALYFYNNLLKSGYLFGMDRFASDISTNIFREYINGITIEFMNMRFFILTGLFIWVIYCIFMKISLRDSIKGLEKGYKVNGKSWKGKWFLIIGMVFFVSFIVLKVFFGAGVLEARYIFHSTFLISIGVVDYLIENIKQEYEKVLNKLSIISYISIAMIIFVFLNIGTLIGLYQEKSLNVNTNMYEQMKLEKLDKYSSVPSESVVVFGDNELHFLRMDIIRTVAKWKPYNKSETAREFVDRILLLSGGSEVYIDLDYFRELSKFRLLNGDDIFDPSLRELLEKYEKYDVKILRIDEDIKSLKEELDKDGKQYYSNPKWYLDLGQ